MSAAGQPDYSAHFPPQEAKALVFDCDGTIVDTMPNHFLAWMETAKAYGFHFDKIKFAQGAGRAEVDQMVDLYKEQGLTPIDFDVACEHKGNAYRALCREKPPPGIASVLAIIKEGQSRGLPMAVVSGSFREDVLLALESAGVKGCFQVILGREDYTKGKPDPEPYLLGASRLGVEPASCVGYEDAEVAGIASIRAAGYLKAEMVKDFKDYPPL